MLKVLAAEMSDPGRLARGKRLRADDAVVDLVIGHGAATAVVQGIAARPVRRDAARPAPGGRCRRRRDVTVRCTCPDDDALGGGACKHAVAALFALADEVSLDLDALARWRQSDGVRRRAHPERRATDDDRSDEPTRRAAAHRSTRSSPSSPTSSARPAAATPGPARADGARRGAASPTAWSPTSSTTRSPTCGCAGTDTRSCAGSPGLQQYFGR